MLSKTYLLLLEVLHGSLVAYSYSFSLSPTTFRVVLDLCGTHKKATYNAPTSSAMTTPIAKTTLPEIATMFTNELANDLHLAGVDAFIIPEMNSCHEIRCEESTSLTLASNFCCLLRGDEANDWMRSAVDDASTKLESTAAGVILPISQRPRAIGVPIDEEQTRQLVPKMAKSVLWKVTSSWSEKIVDNPAIPATTTSTEMFILEGDYSFVPLAINQLLPPRCSCLWQPINLELAPNVLVTTIEVWRLRSNPGIMGLILSWDTIVSQFASHDGGDLELGKLSAYLRKLRQPCSAMDYPPTIFMVGEDEVS